MPVASRTHGEVRIAIARDPALVRTVRLVAAAVARRADCAESLVEEIRLAAGEACAIMIGLEEPAEKSDEQVAVTITTDSAVTVEVTGRVGGDDSGFAEIGLDPWALLRGLSEDLTVSEADGLTTAKLSWPR
jgi:hypothetical protein